MDGGLAIRGATPGGQGPTRPHRATLIGTLVPLCPGGGPTVA